MKGRLRRALSFNAVQTLKEEEEDDHPPLKSNKKKEKDKDVRTGPVVDADDDADETQARDTFRGAVDFREDVIVAFQESEQDCDQRLANESKSEAKPKLTNVDDREIDGDENDNGLSSR